TRAYRKHLEALEGKEVPDLSLYREDLFRVSHREYCTGFYFGKTEVEVPCQTSYVEHHVFVGTVEQKIGNNLYELDVRNKIEVGKPIEYIGPAFPYKTDETFTLLSEEGLPLAKLSHGQKGYLCPSVPLEPGYILRSREETK
ncbi:MAG: U32 family peptidase C-terminal domain-containing protein, partial [Spirochaetales bacterium]